jgi:hydroxyacylglutathione hydrolase
MAFRVVPVPCLNDNYAYLVVCARTAAAAIVDPGEPGPIVDAVRREGVELAAIWATHHHGDHVGGVADVIRELGEIEVVAHDRDRDRVPHASRIVDDGDEVSVGDVVARIVHNPGHTLGAISYVIDGPPGAVFTGDTLFAAGCGRLFEGTAEMMRVSLDRLAALAPETRVYFGHEYTAANLRFAAAVEPDSAAVAERAGRLTAPSTPSTIADERATNPFMRCREISVIAAARAREPDLDASDPTAVLAVIRRWKDTFRPG